MDNSIANILGEGLPKEIATTLQEAFDKKIKEAKQEIEQTVRAELAERYENDKETLVEAMDRMLTDVISKHETEKAEAVAKFVEARTAFRQAIKESRKHFKAKLDENVNVSRQFVAEKVKGEILKLREQKKALVAEKLNTAEQLEVMKEALASEHQAHVAKIEKFVVKQLEKELNEFNEDHRALVETRLKLVAESRKKLRETQSRFVREAAKTVEKNINTVISKEMKQLHEDLERNRQNMFGRRIFEAMAAEFMTSYMVEGTEIRKLQNQLQETKENLSTATKKLDETVRNNQVAERKAKLAEDRAARTKIMSELLTNLRGEKRNVMEGMLETVKTDALKNTFTKLLPVVLDETTARKSPTKKTLVETGVDNRTVITGNQRANRLAESVQTEITDEFDNDIARVLTLANIKH